MNKTRKLLYVAIIFGIFITCISTVAGGYLSYISVKNAFNNVEVDLQKIVNEVNDELPIYIDDQTRFDYASTDGINSIKYTYTLLNLKRSNLTTSDLAEFKNLTEIDLIKYIKEDQTGDFSFFKSNKITLVFEYKDIDANKLIEVSLPYERYR